MELTDVNKIIQDFVETYHYFVQRKDILEVELESSYNKQNYLKYDNKPFVRIDEYKYQKITEIVFGRIHVIMEDIDEEECISFDHERYFCIDLNEFTDPELLKEFIKIECIKHNLEKNVVEDEIFRIKDEGVSRNPLIPNDDTSH